MFASDRLRTEPGGRVDADEKIATFTTSDGRALAYRLTGARSGFPVVWLHGSPGSRLPWPLDKDLPRQLGIRVLTFDRPGFGSSDPQPQRTVAAFAADAAAVVEHLGWSSPGIVGVSNGGPHALAVATALADAAWVVSIGSASLPSSYDPSHAERKTQLDTDPEGHRSSLAAAAMALRTDTFGTLTTYFGDVVPADQMVLADPSVRERLEASMALATAQGAAGWYDDHVAVASDWGFDLASVPCRVVFLHGGADTLCPAEGVIALCRTIERAEMRLVGADGHLSPVRRLAATIEELMA